MKTKTAKTMTQLERQVYDVQLEKIAKDYPNCEVNLGWGVGGGEDSISVASKIYSKPLIILTTFARLGESKEQFTSHYEPY